MPRGFSFVLVTVVMTAMLTFGLLALAGSAADLRLARKAAQSQQEYYALDRSGQRLLASCGDAAARAGRDADAFWAEKRYAGALPEDLPSPARQLVTAYAAGRTNDSTPARRALFFYYLNNRLKALPPGSCSWTVDEAALRKTGTGALAADTPVLSLTASVQNSSAAGRVLNVGLCCDYGGADGYPSFEVSRWTLQVKTETIDPDPILPVWNGKS